jgi:hypothetical protein
MIVQRLEDMAGQMDQLRDEQARQMEAAAAPPCGLRTAGAGGTAATGTESREEGPELTPSLMEELMPSGFTGISGAGSSGPAMLDCGTLYEMSQLSGCSADRDQDGDALVQ